MINIKKNIFILTGAGVSKESGIQTFREKDGLAFSSRNSYLTAKERQKALAIPRLLAQAEKEFKSSKKISPKILCVFPSSTAFRAAAPKISEYSVIEMAP